MTYFGFLLRFLGIPILVLLVMTWWDHKKNRSAKGFADGRAVWIVIAIHVFLAVAYTTPWDNYLVASGVWKYNPQLVTGLVLGYVPIEEYTFFVVETLLGGLWWWFLARRIPSPAQNFGSNKSLVYLSTCILVLLWLIFAYLFFFGNVQWTYLGVTLLWALPAILPQLLFGADILWHYRKLVFWAVFVPGAYLSLADIVALRATTWTISSMQTTGLLFFDILPLEEVVFFFITNILIGFGLTLMLSEIGQQRFEAWRLQKFKGLP